MREIDFRAWSPKWNKMIYHGQDGYTIDVLANTAWLDGCCDECIILMQFVGRKDKNDKKIYEEDIMKIKQRTIGKGAKTKYKYFFIPVEFYDGGFHIPFVDYGKYRFRDGNDWSNSEVIGNIYENPEFKKQMS